ncbi:MAG: lipopolysaccharide biosynthesis protein [Bacteroidaceae bacterium]|nr:lipopolysaccharide biosynthesis protein [Bacteroidaceae bacterium]
MQKDSASNKRIAKNTMFLYFRMLLTMAIGLFTSRIILQVLGVDDYGINTLVGGIVILFTFINNSLLSGTQRFLSFELGKENPNIQEVFSSCFRLHLILSVLFLVAAETVGLWFVNTQLIIPAERLLAANWVYQFSVITCVISIIRCPLNAALISYERMGIYAYIGILEAVLKLAVAYMLYISPIDKLISYSILTFIATLSVLTINTIYALKTLPGVSFTKKPNKNIMKEIINFSKWTIFGSLANVGKEQGLSIIVNFFYGIVGNAAVGVANQVNSHILGFVSNFQVALNPQLTKNEASNNREKQYSLIYKSAKFSYFIMLFLAAPIILNLDYILQIWLGSYPPHTTSICMFVILGVLIETLSGPLWVSIFATGKIKVYQIIISLILLMNIPLAYLVGKMGLPPAGIYAIRALIFIAALLTRLIFLRKLINLKLTDFTKNVILPITIASLPIIAMIFAKYIYLPHTTFASFITESIIIVLLEIIIIGGLGLSKNERAFIKKTVLKKIKR